MPARGSPKYRNTHLAVRSGLGREASDDEWCRRGCQKERSRQGWAERLRAGADGGKKGKEKGAGPPGRIGGGRDGQGGGESRANLCSHLHTEAPV